jgi:hypothetical protein
MIREHDCVRVIADCRSAEGRLVSADLVGTVVLVYGEGDAFAVEFAELSDVVTLERDQVEIKS